MHFENHQDIHSNGSLYSKVQRFYIKHNNSEEKHRDLRVTVDFNNAQSKVSKQILNIQVSDDEDAFFYYSLVLTEEDYQRLKQLQGLLVDFESFPSQVIRLLEQCKEQELNGSRFLLLLEEDKQDSIVGSLKTSLRIVETNNFKHLSHLVLNIEQGNDNDIKKVMLKKIKSLKDQNLKAQKCISDLESQLFSKSKYIDAKECELDDIKHKWKEDRLTFKVESSKELSEETEKLRKTQLDWQIKAQRERNELEEKYQTNLKEKDHELTRLHHENQILQEKMTLSEANISDQSRKIDALEKELVTYRSELTSLRKQNVKFDNDYRERDKQVHGLKTRVAVAEQESKDMAVLLKKQQELLNMATEQKNRLEEVMTEKEENIKRKHVTIQNLSHELVKANEIITKIQKDLTAVSQKLQTRTVIALEQEKVVVTNNEKLDKFKELFKLQEKKIQSLLESEQSFKGTVAQLNDSIEAKDKKIKDNERVIDWLNKRLSSEHSKKTHSPSSVPSKNGVPFTGATSTPFTRTRSQETGVGPALPFATLPSTYSLSTLPSAHGISIPSNHGISSLPSTHDSVRSLDEVRVPPQALTRDQSPQDPSISNKENSQQNLKSDNTPKASDINKKKGIVAGRNLTKKSSTRTVGFKRSTLPDLQATSIPSSYFAK